MADLSKIKLNGEVYNFKDAEARSILEENDFQTEEEVLSAINTSAGRLIPYGYCTTAAATVAKEVTVSPEPVELASGLIIAVKFQYANTGSSPTLNVNNFGAIAIKRYGTTAAGTSAAANWNANSVVLLTYDGTYWQLTDFNNTTYSGMTDAEYQAGTSTTNRLITPARLKAAIQLWAPEVPEWAAAETKPTYTAAEVGAVSSQDIFTANITVIDYDNHTYSIDKTYSEILSAINNNKIIQIKNIVNNEQGKCLYTVLNNSIYLIQFFDDGYRIYELSSNNSTEWWVIDPVTSQQVDAALEYFAEDIEATYSPISHTHSTLQTTAGSNNTEYNLIGTATSNANTSAVPIYNPTLISFAKTNDYGRLTLGSTSTPGRIRLYSSTTNASGFTDLISGASSTNERTITLPDATGTVALTSDIPDVKSWALAANKPSYTFSELTTHPTSLGGYGITDAYTKTEVDGLVSGVLHYKGTKATVSALPSSGNVTGDVWHITADGSEYAWDGSTWQELGTATDLSGYVPTTRTVNNKALSSNISLTASDVGALPSSTTYVSSFNGETGAITYTAPVTSVNGQTGAVTVATSDHAHGNITNAGDITATATIASGDRLIINDESASKVINSSITFGSSTTQYLANNGTWQNVPAAYDDTALAARVTALEQIPWVTYHTGNTAPANSFGNNGDLYLETN